MTNKEKIDIVKSMVIITDTREKKNNHILDFLDLNNINHRSNTMNVGDYTFELPEYPELNLDFKFLVERKASLDELAGNFTTGSERFANEFERLKPPQNLHLVLEDFTWHDLDSHKYRSGFLPKAYRASLLAWEIKYRFQVGPVKREDSPKLIYELLVKELEWQLNNLESFS